MANVAVAGAGKEGHRGSHIPGDVAGEPQNLLTEPIGIQPLKLTLV